MLRINSLVWSAAFVCRRYAVNVPRKNAIKRCDLCFPPRAILYDALRELLHLFQGFALFVDRAQGRAVRYATSTFRASKLLWKRLVSVSAPYGVEERIKRPRWSQGTLRNTGDFFNINSHYQWNARTPVLRINRTIHFVFGFCVLGKSRRISGLTRMNVNINQFVVRIWLRFPY